MNVRSDPDLAITAWLVDEARDGASERLIDLLVATSNIPISAGSFGRRGGSHR